MRKEGSMDMISNTTSKTTTASASQNKQEAVMVASPPREEIVVARTIKVNHAQQKQQVAVSSAGERKPRPQLEQGLNCPHCNSTNTKFCYYNNNSMTQSCYFCKACRRNWTQGGTLRNVPVGGGGSQKNKKIHAGGSSSSCSAPPTSFFSSTNSKMNLTQQLQMMSTVMAPMPAEFPIVFPTFMLAAGGGGLELPGSDHHSLPFPPLSLPPSNPGTTPTLLGMMTGGFLDNGVGVLPFLPPMSSSFGAMQYGHGIMGGSSNQELVGPLHGVDQTLKPPMSATGGSGLQQLPSSAAQEQQVVVGDGSMNDNNNNNGEGHQVTALVSSTTSMDRSDDPCHRLIDDVSATHHHHEKEANKGRGTQQPMWW